MEYMMSVAFLREKFNFNNFKSSPFLFCYCLYFHIIISRKRMSYSCGIFPFEYEHNFLVSKVHPTFIQDPSPDCIEFRYELHFVEDSFRGSLSFPTGCCLTIWTRFLRYCQRTFRHKNLLLPLVGVAL